MDPPQYGRVAISVNLKGNGVLSNTSKDSYLRYLSDKSPLTIEPIFIDPDFLYVEAIIDVTYSTKLTNKSTAELESLIRAELSTYNDTNLDDFGDTLRSSRLSTVIDDVDDGILSTTLCINPIIEYAPTVNLAFNPSFKFESELVKPYPYNAAKGFTNFKPSIVSTTFTYKGLRAKLQDDGNGNMTVISTDAAETQIIDPTIGTVNYTTGEVKLTNFIVENYTGGGIKIYAATTSSNVKSPKNRVLTLRSEDIVINFEESN